MLLPHGVMSSSSNNRRNSNKRGGGGWLPSTGNLFFALAVAIPSYFLGTLSSLYAGLTCTTSSSNMPQQQQFQAPPPNCPDTAKDDSSKSLATDGAPWFEAAFPYDDIGRMAHSLARTSKKDFMDHIDMGVPYDPTPGHDGKQDVGSHQVLIMYGTKAAPDAVTDNPTDVIPMIPSAKDALKNCNYLNIILQGDTRKEGKCVAIVPQYESYHIHKWMRIDKESLKLAKEEPLQYVSKNHLALGLRWIFEPPGDKDRRESWQMIKTYLESIDDVLADLKPILEQIAVQNTVIVMVCNFGQSELLMNFVCAARKRNLDISNVLVFTTDPETTELATSLGLHAYHDYRNFGNTPAEAARKYGDKRFVAMMMAKALVVQVVAMLGYDILFQDVDIVWFRSPLDYFHNTSNPIYNYDVFFQDDGQHSTRYAPYSANSGFYYVRNNPRTVHFLTTLLLSADLVVKTDSHQQAMIAVLSEHASLFGLKVKVLAREMEEFPGGYQWNQKTGKYMHEYYAGEHNPIIFHMSWTENKNNKLKYFQQMGEWYVQDPCIQKKVGEIEGVEGKTGDAFQSVCCAAEALVTCHYADKPSVIPCNDSPLIDKGKRKKFWAEEEKK